MKRRTIFLVVFLKLFLPEALPGSAGDREAVKIAKKIDELYRSKTSYSYVEMEVLTPHWQRALKMYVWTEGMDKTFIRITEPKKEKGMATLRIDNEMWNFLPKTNKVIKVPPSMMMGSWMGSDFTNDDLVKEFSLIDDYIYSLIRPDGAKDECLYLECIPKEEVPIVWSRIVAAVRKSDYIPVWQKYYDEKNKLMRIMRFKKIKDFSGRSVPAVMELVPQNKEGHKTLIRYIDLQFDVPLKNDVFSLRNLRTVQ